MDEKTLISNKRLKIGLVLSLIVHLLFIQLKINFDAPAPMTPNDYVEVTVEDIEKIKEAMKASTAAKTSAAKKQIVNNELSGNEVKPENSRYLGEKDQSYDRQTIAAKIDTFNKAAQGEKTGTLNGDKIQEITKAINKVTAQAVPNAIGTAKKVNLNDLAMDQSSMEEAVQKAAAAHTAKLGVKQGDKNSRGLSSNNDFIETVPLGDFTHLNTTEFKYYGFYHRIRQKLEQFWGNSIREKAKAIYTSGRRLPASENLITSITVDINEQGEIVNVKVVGASGIKELDDAAVESFNKAGPFPNPPSGMVKNGVATIEWGFVVKG